MAAAFLGSIGGEVNGRAGTQLGNKLKVGPATVTGARTQREKSGFAHRPVTGLPFRRRSLCKDGKPPDGPPPP